MPCTRARSGFLSTPPGAATPEWPAADRLAAVAARGGCWRRRRSGEQRRTAGKRRGGARARLVHRPLAAATADAHAVDHIPLLRLVPQAPGLVRAAGARDAVHRRQLAVLPHADAQQEAEHVALLLLPELLHVLVRLSGGARNSSAEIKSPKRQRRQRVLRGANRRHMKASTHPHCRGARGPKRELRRLTPSQPGKTRQPGRTGADRQEKSLPASTRASRPHASAASVPVGQGRAAGLPLPARQGRGQSPRLGCWASCRRRAAGKRDSRALVGGRGSSSRRGGPGLGLERPRALRGGRQGRQRGRCEAEARHPANQRRAAQANIFSVRVEAAGAGLAGQGMPNACLDNFSWS